MIRNGVHQVHRVLGALVVVALSAFEQELEHRALFIGERHGRDSVGERGPRRRIS